MNESPESSDDSTDVFRFRKKALQVSLCFDRDDLDISPDFEGETTSVSRLGMGCRVDPVRHYKTGSDELEEETVFVRFHVPWADHLRPKADVEMVGESNDPRFSVYLGLTFAEEIDLTRLISGP